ncbi:ribosome small subunit-dependent GTPase A [Flavobacteriaceae bacterium]|nr:ribosome small subunit-dependent GTPase A [Flavobacteriaceae bacterium]
MEGVVYRSTGSWYTVKSGDTFYPCRMKGKLRLEGIKSTNPVAVGDRVHFDLNKKDEALNGVITEIFPRQNYIVRKSVNLSKQTHIIAANIDQVFLMITHNNPPTSHVFIDRFLITAEAYQIPAVLLFNKWDAYTETEKEALLEVKAIYEAIGYESYIISALKQQETQTVKEKMKGKVSMFAGHSGVGKSTLANAIAPGLNLKTAAISTSHQQGQHTTTFAEMFDLDEAISIIDTPGIKGFGVVDMQAEEIGNYFPEIFARKGACKFNNCSHLNEPQCAIIDAVDREEIALSRYQSYCQLLEEDTTYRS